MLKLTMIKKDDLKKVDEITIYINPFMVKTVRPGWDGFGFENTLIQMEGTDIDVNRIYVKGNVDQTALLIEDARISDMEKA